MFSRKGFRAIPSETTRTDHSTADADIHQRPDSTDRSPENLILLQRTIGNQAVRRLLQPPQTRRGSGKTANVSIQRALIDGGKQREQFDTFSPDKMDNKTSTELNVALINYAALMQRNTNTIAGQTEQEKGATFYADVDRQLTIIDKASDKFLDHKKHSKFDTQWLKTLVEQDIPETQATARWVQHNFAKYQNSTYLHAMTTANTERKTSLMDYVQNQSPTSWDQMPDDQKKLLANNRDSDAARVAAIRKHAQTMMEKKSKPRKILDYMAQEATSFVRDVVKEYVAVAGLQQSDLAVVSTGSFGSGEMFPYSDVDVQIMTTSGGDGALNEEQMYLILHNIRMRVRLANMQDSTGQWKNTMGWDVDQLVQDGFTPETAVARDSSKALAQSALLYATPGGAQLPGDLKDRYATQGKEAAKAKMEMDLYMSVKQGDWWMKKPDKLNQGGEPIEFKEKFMRLPKIFLNVLAMHDGLSIENSWDRIDELVRRKRFSSSGGAAFKEYLDIVAKIRLKYQFFYQQEGLDTISPTPGRIPANRETYPKGYYTLTNEDRAELIKAQQIQQDYLTQGVLKLKSEMDNSTTNPTTGFTL